MRKQSENIHEGHRKRLQERYDLGGADGLSDHNLLEMLLFYSIPRVDTNEIAHRLMNTFGTLENVFKADTINLMTVSGIGENSARQIKLIFDIFNRIIEQRCQDRANMFDKETVKDFLVSKMSKYNDEVLFLIMLNLSGEMISSSIIGKGGKHFVNIDVRKILEPAYACGAASVILAHNHPDGRLLPSKEDIAATGHIHSCLRLSHLRLTEHYIVNSKGIYGIIEHVCNEGDSALAREFKILRGE